MRPAKRRGNGIRRVKVKEDENTQSLPNNTAAPSPASPSLPRGIFGIPRDVLKRLVNPVPRQTPDGESIH